MLAEYEKSQFYRTERGHEYLEYPEDLSTALTSFTNMSICSSPHDLVDRVTLACSQSISLVAIETYKDGKSEGTLDRLY